ncbi:MAG: hypothetical protein ACP5G2_05210 [Candidatus Bipolaricaulaceae bacterium]
MRAVAMLLAALAAAAPGWAQNLCDYRAPETSLQDLNLSFYYRHYEDPATPGADISSGRLYLSYSRLFDSPALGYAFDGSTELSLTNLSLAGMAAQASGTVRRYLGEELPYFAFGGVESSLAFGQTHPALEVRAGLGYGHFTDVTPMAMAYHIEGKLLRMGALAAPLSDQNIADIAAELGRAEEYEDVSALVAAVEGIVEQQTGVTLDARALLAIEDVIQQTGRERYCGYAIQFGMGYELLDPQQGPRDFLLALSADGAVAPTPDSQLLVRGSLSGPYRLLEQYTLVFAASYDYQLNGTTSFAAKYNLRQVKPPQQTPAGKQSATFQLGFDLGGLDLTLQVVFSKTAEAQAWTQDLLISAVMDIL